MEKPHVGFRVLNEDEQCLPQVSRLIRYHFGRIRLDQVRRKQKAKYISYKIKGGEEGIAKRFIDQLKKDYRAYSTVD